MEPVKSIHASLEIAGVVFLPKCKTTGVNARTREGNGNKSWHQLVLFQSGSVAVKLSFSQSGFPVKENRETLGLLSLHKR